MEAPKNSVGTLMDRRIIFGTLVAIIIVLGGIWYATHSSLEGINTALGVGVPVISTTTSGQITASTTEKASTSSTSKGVPKSSKSPVPTVGLPPYIQKFIPAGATTGTQVTIEGADFDPTTNYVYFGTSSGRHHSDGTADNMIATVGSVTGKSITFTVPASGPSGLLCDAQNSCMGVSATAITPGEYPVYVRSKYGTSAVMYFDVVK